MEQTERDNYLIEPNDLILVTGATGYIGSRLVQSLLDRGFRNVRCFVRPSAVVGRIQALSQSRSGIRVEVVTGNLLSQADCLVAAKDAAVIFHLAAGRGVKSYPDAFMNSVVTTRNLLEASRCYGCLRRFVNISSFAVYTNHGKRHWRMLDESCPVEEHPELRGDAYSFAKSRQDKLVIDYCQRFGLPYVIVRPGYVYGPGKKAITGRVGIDTFGIFLHLGTSNRIPFTYVDNCAEAIMMAGLTKGVDGEVFNVVDDDLPSSRQFLRQYKRNVKRFTSLYVPHFASYMLSYLWELYSKWSQGQLPPAFNRKRWNNNWKKTNYSNHKLKSRLGWTPKVSTAEGLVRYFEYCRDAEDHA
jgi:nucleoside-diphosphate-sugar epimerase